MPLTDREKKLIDKLSKIDDYANHFDNLKNELKNLYLKVGERLREAKEVESHIQKIVEEKSKGFPWISDVIAEYFEARDLKLAEFLEQKLRPAASTASRVRQLAKEKRLLKKEFLIAKNFVNYYETLFPWLQDFVDDDLDDLIEQLRASEAEKNEEIDPVKYYVTQSEYEKLSVVERNQRALERYWQRKKTSWEIGRDYERYVGYCYEKMGFKVFYHGIELGLADLGRDLVCTNGHKTEVVQCKYWSKEKRINEKHVNQLFGTTVKYIIDNDKTLKITPQMTLFPDLMKSHKIAATFMTTTEFTDTAREFANALGIRFIENDNFNHNYPCLKCNISKSTGEKIYHLPFDQQYDSTIIEFDKGEFYAKDTYEAERKGFRRAWRWRGNNE